MGFYYERLYNLFFHGLGAQDDVGIIKINRGGVWAKFIGQVPYLNGGLFEEEDDDKEGGIKVPDQALRSILHDLFDRFNFTVTEATPLDVEVAVDPEMLGKVFEELVTGRHESGSYYTPKPIVSFMCREALKGYLEANLPKEKAEPIARFVDEHDPTGLRDAENVLEVLRRVRVCDPACGSGAYLLGMLHELMDLRSCLFKTKNVDSISTYERKLEIIQRNLYGVDLDPFAVNIARLRLWLSLAVDFEGDHPEPLPNLKFEIEEGDSLSAPGPQPSQGLMRDAVVREFSSTKAEYIKAHGEKKKKLEKHVLDLKQSIATWTHGKESVSGFDWPVEFAEVFQEGGFDIIVANPPYVRMELFKAIKPTLKRNFPKVHAERADLYCYFYARAVELLRPAGMLVFISSNKWLRSGYGENLRDFIGASCSILQLIDFGDLPVFKSATSYPMILSARRENTGLATVFTKVNSLDPPYPEVRQLVENSGHRIEGGLHGKAWALTDARSSALVDKMRKTGTPLVEYCKDEIYRGIVSGLNEAFVVDGTLRRQLVENSPGAKKIIKQFVFGRDIRRWRVEGRDQWLLYMFHGIKAKDHTALIDHLRPYKAQLEGRATEQEWYELQQPQMRYQVAFEKPKIVVPDIAKGLRFALDRSGSYVSNTVYFIPRDDLFLLGVLNSLAVEFFYSELSTQVRGGYMRFFRQYMERIPIPYAPSKEKDRIAALVEKCLDANGTSTAKWEREIDERVAALYGIDLKDIQKNEASSVKASGK